MTDQPTIAPGTTAGSGPAPMADQRLAKIREHSHRQHASEDYLSLSDYHVADLLDEVYRLRADLAARDRDQTVIQAAIDGWQDGHLPPHDALVAIRDTLTGHIPDGGDD